MATPYQKSHAIREIVSEKDPLAFLRSLQAQIGFKDNLREWEFPIQFPTVMQISIYIHICKNAI